MRRDLRQRRDEWAVELKRQEALSERDRRYRRNVATAVAIVAVLDPFGGTSGLLTRAAAVVRPGPELFEGDIDVDGVPQHDAVED